MLRSLSSTPIHHLTERLIFSERQLHETKELIKIDSLFHFRLLLMLRHDFYIFYEIICGNLHKYYYSKIKIQYKTQSMTYKSINIKSDIRSQPNIHDTKMRNKEYDGEYSGKNINE